MDLKYDMSGTLTVHVFTCCTNKQNIYFGREIPLHSSEVSINSSEVTTGCSEVDTACAELTASSTMDNKMRLEKFQQKINSTVEFHHGYTFTQIKDFLTEYNTRDHSSTSCLLILLIAPGDRSGRLFFSDEFYDPRELISICDGPTSTLGNKPRIFVFQSMNINDNDLSFIPTNYATIYSSFEGYEAYGTPNKGTWMIQDFCESIEKYYIDDITKTTTHMTHKVSKRLSNVTDCNSNKYSSKQIPHTHFALVDNDYFKIEKDAFSKRQYGLLIIAHSDFRRNSYLNGLASYRTTIGADVDALTKVFGKFGFRHVVFYDHTFEELVKKISNYCCKKRKVLKKLCVVFLTHGEESGVLHASDRTYYLDVLQSIFNQSFYWIPKLYLIQACRGKKADLGKKTKSDDGTEDVIPHHANALVLKSVEDYNEDKCLSPILDHFCTTIEENTRRNEHLLRMISSFHKAKLDGILENSTIVETSSTLSKLIVFRSR